MFDVYPINNVNIVRAEGSWVWDDNGERYLDMYGGHAVISIGHSNNFYINAVTRQLERIGFYSNSVIIEQQAELADKLGKLSKKEDYALFLCNSGAEANENAMKLASFHTGRKKILAFRGAFHGRTSLAVAVTDNPAICAPVNQTVNVVWAKYNDSESLEKAFAEHGEELAGVIIECIQGVGGIKVANIAFLRQIRQLCNKYGVVFIADEIQCGCGRTGEYYALDYADVKADIYTMAKGIANGFPIGAIAIAPFLKPKHGMLGTTFGGNHLACAAAISVCDVIKGEKLMDNAIIVGNHLMDEIRQMPGVKEVRGKGLMIGIELEFEAADIRRKLLEKENIFTGYAGKTVVRLLPSLTLSMDEADRFLNAFGKLLAKATKQHA